MWVQFVADGVFFAELNEMLTRELAEDGYSGVEIRNTPLNVHVIIRATRTKEVLGKLDTLSLNPLKLTPDLSLNITSVLPTTAKASETYRVTQCCRLTMFLRWTVRRRQGSQDSRVGICCPKEIQL